MYGIVVTGGSTTSTTSTVQPPPPPGIKEKIYTWVDLPPAGAQKKDDISVVLLIGGCEFG